MPTWRGRKNKARGRNAARQSQSGGAGAGTSALRQARDAAHDEAMALAEMDAEILGVGLLLAAGLLDLVGAFIIALSGGAQAHRAGEAQQRNENDGFLHQSRSLSCMPPNATFSMRHITALCC